MSNFPLISVIVPAYNAECYIKRCIKSVLNQSYIDWELLIVDDGSTDNTFNIATDFMLLDSRIHVIHTDNYGVCSARNHGIEIAKGEYIAFLDVDDEYEPYTLEKLYILCEENACDIAIGQCIRIKDSGEIIESRFPQDFEIWKKQEAVVHSLEDHPATYSVWGKLYKKTIVGETRFDFGHKVHEDSFFLFELLLKNPTVVVKNEYIYRYYITQNSASREAFSDKFLDIRYFVEKKRRIINEKYPEFKKYIPNLIVKADMALLSILSNTSDKKYFDVEKQCCQEIIMYKKYFKPATKENKKWFWILTHHLYKPYKFLSLLIRKYIK